jgi:hypothetical protein
LLLDGLPDSDQSIIRKCVEAITFGSFLDDPEMHPRIGLDRGELISVLDHWSEPGEIGWAEQASIAINSCLNEICFGLEISNRDWSTWIPVPRSEVERVFALWRSQSSGRNEP